jgi:SAM-dependent methyltransferase
VITAADRFESIHRARLAAGLNDWNDRATVAEIQGHLAELLPRAGQEEGEVLEFGCGTGTLTLALADRGYQVTGLDISSTAVRYARCRARDANLAASFYVHDVTQPLPAIAGRFSVVLDGLVLHYLTAHGDRLAALRLAGSSLRPGGSVIVITMCGQPRYIPPGSRFDPAARNLITDDLPECHYADPVGLTDLFREAGLNQDYSRLVIAGENAKDQDLYLAVLRR